jgi:hypothetical protein
MYKSKTKLLVSGCGITYTGQPARTWATIVKLAGIEVIDVSGPAVSNQWIINRAFLAMQADSEIKHAVIQLTALGKLDVEIDQARQKELVEPDSIRNFAVDGVWPSSASTDHASKALWRQWLFSPGLEQQDLVVKLTLLHHWCQQQGIKLTVIQGYDLHWKPTDPVHDLITNSNWDIMSDYKSTKWYQSPSKLDVPVIEYQWELAVQLINLALPDHAESLQNLHKRYFSCR